MNKQIKRRNFLSVLLTTVISIVCVILVLFLAVLVALKITDTDISYLKLDNLYAELVSEDGETKSVLGEAGISTEKSFLGTTVTLTIPDVLGEYVNKEPTLTEEQKEQGFKSVKKDSNGNLVYTMSRSSYEKYIEEYKKNIVESFKTFVNDNITDITYNDDFTEIKVTVNVSELTMVEETTITALCMAAQMYQYFDVDVKDGTPITVTTVNTSGTVLDTYTYPEEQ